MKSKPLQPHFVIAVCIGPNKSKQTVMQCERYTTD